MTVSAKDLIAALMAHLGEYRGEGTNHEGERFTGRLTLSDISQRSGLLLTFEAKEPNEGTVFHVETSIVAADPAGAPVLWNMGSNLGFMAPHRLRSASLDGERVAAVFRFEAGDEHHFVEEISLDVDGRVGTYAFAWGYDGTPFEPRSSARMVRSAAK